MEPRDAAPSVDGAQRSGEPMERPGSDVESRWFDVRTAAKYLCMTQHAIYHRINRCQLPFIRDGRRIRFDREALDRWIRKGEKYGFTEARRHLVLPEDDQRAAVPRIHLGSPIARPPSGEPTRSSSTSAPASTGGRARF